MNYINKAARQDAALKEEMGGGITPQTAPADLTDAPEAADFNGLVALLVAAGVLTA